MNQDPSRAPSLCLRGASGRGYVELPSNGVRNRLALAQDQMMAE